MKIFIVEAMSFTSRIPCKHRFEIAGYNEEDVINAVKNRWPEFYDIKVYEK